MLITPAFYDPYNQLIAPPEGIIETWFERSLGPDLDPRRVAVNGHRGGSLSHPHHHDMPLSLTPGWWHYWGVTVNSRAKVNRVIDRLDRTTERLNGTVVSFHVTTMVNNDLRTYRAGDTYLYHIAAIYVIEELDHVPYPRLPHQGKAPLPGPTPFSIREWDLGDGQDFSIFAMTTDPRKDPQMRRELANSVGRLHEPV